MDTAMREWFSRGSSARGGWISFLYIPITFTPTKILLQTFEPPKFILCSRVDCCDFPDFPSKKKS